MRQNIKDGTFGIFTEAACGVPRLRVSWRRLLNLPTPCRHPLPKSAPLAGTTTLCADLQYKGWGSCQLSLCYVLLQRPTLKQTQRGINMPAPRSDVCSAVFPHALQKQIMANTYVAVNMSLGLAGTKDDTGLA